ncbi:FAD-dependent oxidoreductase [Luteimonas sp. BDR2-5]|uniref:NAD(P)/FAD-dependent oxidoreductase n=1 Tax=Proluteimonas luteida TaxID=2878685 RepID=UPI001E4750A6|nr:FAD-dependent oxidoreductase [Luteimonas sp. BDR2-5]MCD9027978.1 FAD-dependent oxidoreductase [Luteimonas sp. BDR2-5]
MTQQIGHIVIVGAGQAAANAAAELRRTGHAGPIAIVGEEPHAPYERPQLSKDMLRPGCAGARCMRETEAYARDGIDLHLGVRVRHVDAARREVQLDDGRRLPYGHLLIATGVRPRPLPPALHASPRVRYLRSIGDAEALRADLDAGHPLAIVGGGVIGLEVAAAARARGVAVTLVEAGERLMQRGVDPLVSRFLDRTHRARGVDIRYGLQAEALEDDGTLRLSDGSRVPAARVLVGIGVLPNVEPFAHLGIADAAGIRVDAFGRTAVPGIHAIGDIASQPVGGRHGRIETWANAQDQAITVARNLVAEPVPYAAPTWFWSDQGQTNLQVVGDATTGRTVVRGDADGDAFSVFRLDDAGRVTGCATVNAPKDMALARRWVRQRQQVEPQRLADPAIPLRDCAA